VNGVYDGLMVGLVLHRLRKKRGTPHFKMKQFIRHVLMRKRSSSPKFACGHGGRLAAELNRRTSWRHGRRQPD